MTARQGRGFSESPEGATIAFSPPQALPFAKQSVGSYPSPSAHRSPVGRFAPSHPDASPLKGASLLAFGLHHRASLLGWLWGSGGSLPLPTKRIRRVVRVRGV